MACGEKRIDAGNLTFGVRYRVISGDQGVTIRAMSSSTGEETELLSFDCFDQQPHYHYGAGGGGRQLMDKTTTGEPRRLDAEAAAQSAAPDAGASRPCGGRGHHRR